jgi:hypothetical protein
MTMRPRAGAPSDHGVNPSGHRADPTVDGDAPTRAPATSGGIEVSSVATPVISPSQPETDAFLAYWKEQVCVRGGLLGRRQIDATQLQRILPNVWLYERLEDGDYLCRLAGEEVHRRWQRSISRHRLSEFSGAREYAVIRARFDLVTGRSLLAFGTTRTPGGWVVERLYGPVLDDADEPRLILGCSARIPWQALQIAAGDPMLIQRMDLFDPVSLAFVESAPLLD